MPSITIRFATADDVPLILGFIKALARFENEPDAVKTTPEDLLRDGFGERPRFEVLIAERDEKPVGFAPVLYDLLDLGGTAEPVSRRPVCRRVGA